MNSLTEYGRTVLKRALILVAVSVLAAAVLIFAFTDLGMGLVFRLGVYMTSGEVNTADTVYLEYYDAKAQASAADGVHFYMGQDHASGWTAALDFLKFVKQNVEITELRMDVSAEDADAVNAYLRGEEAASLANAALSSTEGDFLKRLADYNAKLPPQKRVSIAPLDGESDASDKAAYTVYYESYRPERAEPAILDVSAVYVGSETADPLFDLPLRAGSIRFGSAEKLQPYTGRLEAVSGNFGRERFVGLGQAPFYFLIAEASEDMLE